jgi:hypothetical protein
MLFTLNFNGVSGLGVLRDEQATSNRTQTEFPSPELRFESKQSRPPPNGIDSAATQESQDFLRRGAKATQYNSRAPACSNERQNESGYDCDPLLPVQYYESVVGGHLRSGEFRLYLAILEDALRCYVRTKKCRTRAQRVEFLDASNWFHERSTAHVFSFDSVCAFLDLDPTWLIRRLELLGPTDLPRKQCRTSRSRGRIGRRGPTYLNLLHQ